MSPSIPFIDPETGGLRTEQIKSEAFRLTGLIALFGGLALVPYVLALVFDGTALALVLLVVTQLVLAVGAGIVLMYCVARGVQLAGNDAHNSVRSSEASHE